MGYLLDCVNEWKGFVEKYGEPLEISAEAAKGLPKERIWTKWSKGSDFLANEFAVDPEVICYLATPNPWTESESSITVTETDWLDCPTCDENQDDDDWDQDGCVECEGAGVLAIYIPDCLNAKTEEEIFNRREA